MAFSFASKLLEPLCVSKAEWTFLIKKRATRNPGQIITNSKFRIPESLNSYLFTNSTIPLIAFLIKYVSFSLISGSSS